MLNAKNQQTFLKIGATNILILLMATKENNEQVCDKSCELKFNKNTLISFIMITKSEYTIPPPGFADISLILPDVLFDSYKPSDSDILINFSSLKVSKRSDSKSIISKRPIRLRKGGRAKKFTKPTRVFFYPTYHLTRIKDRKYYHVNNLYRIPDDEELAKEDT